MIKEPKIIIWDLEIIPDTKAALKYWTKLCPPWGGSQTLKADVSSICTFGYKILNEGKAKTINAWDFPAWETDVNNDKELCKKIYEILSTADAWIFQNGDWFDKRHILTRLLLHKLPPLPKIPTIDTKKIAKRNLLTLSNSLDHLTKQFAKERKLDHQEKWDLWVDTHNKKTKAMKLMSKYCKQDVMATECLFKTLRPLITNIPNYNLFDTKTKKSLCPSCGSTRLKSYGWRHTKTTAYQRFRCVDCNSFSQTPPTKNLPRSI